MKTRNVAVLLAGALVATGAHAQCEPHQVTTLHASDGAPLDAFGSALAVSGDVGVVGSWLDDDDGPGSGSAYVFERRGGTWSETAKLLPGAGAMSDNFGWSIGVDGDTIVVGAIGADGAAPNSGIAYVFERSGDEWTETATLVAEDGALDDIFAYSVAIDGDTIVVGSIFDDDLGPDSGSAYVFERMGDEWVLAAKLLPDDGEPYDVFGVSVAIDTDTIVIGATYDDTPGIDAGSAYVFERSGDDWTQVARLSGIDSATFDSAGRSVAVSADAILMGSWRDDDNGIDSGSALVFRRVGGLWMQTAKLTPDDASPGDLFGYAVAIEDDVAVVGTWRDDDNGVDAGAAYVFRFTGDEWTQSAKIVPDDAHAFDNAGWSVDVAGDTVLVGALGDDQFGDSAGAAHVFDLSCGCPADFNGDGQLNILDFVAFQEAFVAHDPDADCDSSGDFNILDFVCYQGLFVAGCD